MCWSAIASLKQMQTESPWRKVVFAGARLFPVTLKESFGAKIPNVCWHVLIWTTSKIVFQPKSRRKNELPVMWFHRHFLSDMNLLVFVGVRIHLFLRSRKIVEECKLIKFKREESWMDCWEIRYRWLSRFYFSAALPHSSLPGNPCGTHAFI